MRKGFDGLCGLVHNEFLQNPLSGSVYIFFNRPKNRIKLLHWQGDGFAVFYKRLEKGTYELPQIKAESTHAEISAQQLLLILEGISLLSIKKRKRYEQKAV
ncbi:MAG: IS66 family insertion sequence element accessory protein TnpB [Bacteroidetes bacterium]|nr:IS66 family insertion sequence element accessory protein TnpB [Bacteroidota bacterium]